VARAERRRARRACHFLEGSRNFARRFAAWRRRAS